MVKGLAVRDYLIRWVGQHVSEILLTAIEIGNPIDRGEKRKSTFLMARRQGILQYWGGEGHLPVYRPHYIPDS